MQEGSGQRGKDDPLRVILARHGETALNVEGRFRGRAEAPLTPRGQEQATRLGAALAGFRPELLLASPRGRAIDSARAIGARTSVEPGVEPRLEDIDYGEWTGLTRVEVSKRWPTEYEQYLRDPERAAFPGGETLFGLETRIAELLSELSKRLELRVVVLVTHDVVIRALVCRFLDAPLRAMHRLRVDVASTTGISLANDKTTIDWVNNTSHLEQKAPS